VILVAITLALGGVLYTQFKGMVTSEVRNPSLSLIDTNVGVDGKTVLLDVKNDGNVAMTISQVLFQYQSTSERFNIGVNASVLAGSATLDPGSVASLRVTLAGITLPSFSTFTLTLVTDQLAEAFSVQA
jgi:hypothetical protein